MNVEITPEEYERLLQMLFIAGRVMTGHKQDEPRAEKYEALIQKFFRGAAETGKAGLVTFDPDLESYLPAAALQESEAGRLLDQYADENFWHELIFRLTDRDVERRSAGTEKNALLSQQERFDLETQIEERYIEEFEEHGIDRLEIVDRFGPVNTLTTSD